MGNNSTVKFFSISSGSCGNCYFLSLEEDGAHSAGVVIDAGVSLRRLKKELLVKGYGFDSFSAILVTHDHLDHIRHLGSFCKHLCKPVFATPVLHSALAHHPFTSSWIGGCSRELRSGDWNVIVPDKIFAKYFIVPHDATQTVGYALWLGGYKFVIMTDIGEMTEEALAYARNADTVVIESNYDKEMLLTGSYPYDLKMRILGGNGHLRNDQCAEAVKEFMHDGLRNVFLCHLSENNNTPELALSASSDALESIGFHRTYERSAVFVNEGDGVERRVNLRALPRRTPSPLYVL
ncbi:MAG: MBL fold metallo-hydrolase [Bacteroidales bacterium]|jgi:phosphoribosyl 1,2-cyclic phosphodiesterase|nr:MBL fold metallo-hydrolase [Bacteroidales bacterium]